MKMPKSDENDRIKKRKYNDFISESLNIHNRYLTKLIFCKQNWLYIYMKIIFIKLNYLFIVNCILLLSRFPPPLILISILYLSFSFISICFVLLSYSLCDNSTYSLHFFVMSNQFHFNFKAYFEKKIVIKTSFKFTDTFFY